MGMLSLAEIGKRIRGLREDFKIPRAELAGACGVTETVIEEIEAGTLDPLPGDYVLIVARFLKTDFRYFISEELDPEELGTRRVYRAFSEGTPGDLWPFAGSSGSA